MCRLQGTVELENIEVTYSARMERNDYGVPGSPVWYEPTDVEIDEVLILGVPVPVKNLPLNLQSDLLALSYEVEGWE